MTSDEQAQRKAERLGQGLGDTNGLSWTCNHLRVVGAQELLVSPRDRNTLRALAQRVAEIAAWPAQTDKKRLWLAHNALGATRPLLFADPENAWPEYLRLL